MRETVGIYSGRFSGAGFRRCCMALIYPDNADDIRERVEREYLTFYPEPKSHWCTTPFYLYKEEDVKKIRRAVDEGCGTDAPGSLAAWMCRHAVVHSMEMPGKRYDIGDLKSYEAVSENYRGITELQ